MAKAKTKQQLTVENEELRARLQELEDTLEAIRSGAVDAIVTSGPAGDRVYTLEGADHAYHTMVESMNEGAVTVLTDGTILYANRQFGQMTGASPSAVVGRPFHDFVQTSDRPIWNGFIRQAGYDGLKAEIRLGNQSAAGIPVQISATPIDISGTKALALVVTDLTETRRYEEIVAAERLSRYILEQSLEGVAVCVNGRILFASRRLHEIYGGNPLMQPFDRLFPLRMSGSETFSAEIPQSGKVVKDLEVSYQNPDGKGYSLIINAGPLYGDNHKIIGCLVNLTDITERKLGEEEIARLNRELEHRLQEMEAVFHTAPIGLAITEDPEGRHIRGNPANEQMLGMPRGSELSTRSGADPAPARYRTSMGGRELAVDELPMQRAARGENVSGQIMDVVREDGSTIRLFSNASPLLDEQGRPRGAVGAFLDITELSRAQDALRESESRFREMAETVPEILFTALPNGSMDYVNERGLDYAGLSAGEAMGKGWIKAVHPEDLERSVRTIRESRRTGRPYEVRQRLRAADGSYRWFLARARAILDEKGKILKWFGNATDIHDMMQVEDALQTSEARFRLLSGTAGRLLATDDPQGLVEELCRDVMEHLDCQAFFNFMVDERAGRLRLNACAGIPEEEVRKLEWLDYGVAVCGCVARDGARIVAEDIFHTPDARTELVKSYGIRAYCCHPLKARDRLIGTLSFGTKTRSRFTPEEIELMRIVADQVAVAMQRIQAKQEIVESNQRLQLALEAGGMGMWAWDLQTNRMIWNSKEYELMGLPVGDGVADAEEFFRCVHPEDAPGLRDALGEVIARGSLFMREFRIVRSGGQLHWLAAVGRVIRAESGQPLSIIGINYDVTDRKKILEVLRESEERFRGAFEQSFSGIVICDFEGRILEVNPSFCRMLGYEERELVGLNILDLTHSEDREIEWAKAMELKEGRLGGFRLEKRFLGKGGRVIWSEIGVSALHDEKGNIVNALGMAEDITERKAAREALLRSKDELEEKVRERTTELMLLLEELEKGRDDLRKLASELVMAEERERKRIAVTLHDEVAQTLAAAKMRLDLLRKVTDGVESGEVVDEARELLMQSIRETRSLMTDISSPILYEMGLAAAVQNLAEQTSASYGLAVSHDVAGEFGNLGQELTVMIYQAVRELLHNVSKHSQARNVSVRVIAEDTAVRAIVADDGRGFEMGEVGLPRREGGFGLFSIRERVKSFHGNMLIDSAPGQGTVVTVVLPTGLGDTEKTLDGETASPRGRRRRKT
ncbi:MAG TPA: PAS domain S-box protein [Syntrophales bacterium]|nr:PAS domain S-box protein [Syntrophales bacterium]